MGFGLGDLVLRLFGAAFDCGLQLHACFGTEAFGFFSRFGDDRLCFLFRFQRLLLELGEERRRFFAQALCRVEFLADQCRARVQRGGDEGGHAHIEENADDGQKARGRSRVPVPAGIP